MHIGGSAPVHSGLAFVKKTSSGAIKAAQKVIKTAKKGHTKVPDTFVNAFIEKHHSLKDNFPKGSNMRRMKDLLKQMNEKRMTLKPYAHPGWLVLAIIAATINLVAAIAQVSTVVKNRSAQDLSWVFLGGIFIVHLLWTSYSFGHKLWVGFTSSLLAMVFIAILMVLKSMYDVEE